MSILDIPDKPGPPDLVAAIAALEQALEAQVARNDKRLTSLEGFMAEHDAGRARRQAQVDQLTADNAKLRWAIANGRRA